jgi:hypothetical protein
VLEGAMTVGGWAMLPKPVDFEQLLPLVAEVVGSAS